MKLRVGLELRRLQTLAATGAVHNSTIVAMLPTELLPAARRLAGGDPVGQASGPVVTAVAAGMVARPALVGEGPITAKPDCCAEAAPSPEAARVYLAEGCGR